MKKTIIFSIIGLGLVAVLIWFGKMNTKSVEVFETETAFKSTIVKKTVATGMVTPLEEVELKPQISGIIDEIFLEEGAIVKKGDLIATVRVVPDEQSLTNAKGQVSNLEISLRNAKVVYDRNKSLFDKGVIARQEFENSELTYIQAEQNLKNIDQRYSDYAERLVLAKFYHKNGKKVRAIEILDEVIAESEHMTSQNRRKYRQVLTNVRKFREELDN